MRRGRAFDWGRLSARLSSKLQLLSIIQTPPIPTVQYTQPLVKLPNLALPLLPVAMPSADGDPRIASVKPRITYNTIGGVNGPLVILDNVSFFSAEERAYQSSYQSSRRSNFPDTMRLCLSLYPMAQCAQDRYWKLEVSGDKLQRCRT